MRKETVRKKWVAALRSGKYEQAKGQLRKGDAYCCLGVLCELAVKAKIISQYNDEEGVLPLKVKLWVGLRNNEGGYGEGYRTLATRNDSGHWSFKRIATLIEKEPKGLFV